MQFLAALEAVVGVAIVAAVVYDVFESVIVPRPSQRFRVSVFVLRGGWRVWRASALGIADARQREDFLGRFAPLSFVALLVCWLVLLIVGFGFVFHALAEQLHPPSIDLRTAMFFAAGALLPTGSNVTPVGSVAHIVALFASAIGVAVVAVMIAFLFQLLGAFAQREEFVLILGARAGAPPSGVTILETNAQLQLKDAVSYAFVEGQHWASRVLDTHLAYPLLFYFRSSHVNHAWLATLGALLDASVFVLTAIRQGPRGDAQLFYEIGTHLVGDLGDFFELSEPPEVGVERWEFERACERLAAAGYDVDTSENAWTQFCRLRSGYAATLNSMARFWAIPPAQWIGDRSTIHPKS